MKAISLIIFSLVLPFIGFAQEDVDFSQFSGTTYEVTMTKSVPGISYLNYPKKAVIDEWFTSPDSVAIDQLEDFVKALYSANSRNWINQYLSEPGVLAISDAALADRTQSELRALKLLSKLSVEKEGLGIITFVKVSENGSSPEVIAIQQGTIGYKVIEPGAELALWETLITTLKPDVFRMLIIGHGSNDAFISGLLERTRVQNTAPAESLDVARLVDELERLKTANDTENLKKISDAY